MATLSIIAVIIAAVIAGWAARDLLQRYRDMQRRIAKLEASQAKRMPYHTTDDVMDALANLNSMMFEEQVRMEQIESARAKLLKIMGENKGGGRG